MNEKIDKELGIEEIPKAQEVIPFKPPLSNEEDIENGSSTVAAPASPVITEDKKHCGKSWNESSFPLNMYRSVIRHCSN